MLKDSDEIISQSNFLDTNYFPKNRSDESGNGVPKKKNSKKTDVSFSKGQGRESRAGSSHTPYAPAEITRLIDSSDR